MAAAGGGRRKRLAAHLEAAFAEIERLANTYRVGIERLDSSVRADLSPSAVRQWFQMVRDSLRPAGIAHPMGMYVRVFVD